ncbi:N-acyl-D-glucosamine 2-epimerase [Paenibacillus mesophilus]|uniref:N-acyl-D-glucosamine 2-epimerase n=1 Tax=Paenibacillus mesophilus TaxID=2582849 RepID=UPI00110E22A0|nr:N-acyl-D-glucosamine 2-epimerase [Paenibacillus mesophilus]TMV50127.1 N-acyl-D-glucosamine 2-epimerase [Paenibacillus mesophilus]
MEASVKRNGLYGPSIQLDPLFPYYENRSPESIAEELEAAGYGIVRYFVVNENKVKAELIRALQDRGIFVWALVLGNGTFSTESYPDDWPAWQMELLKPCNDGYTRFSYFSDKYVQWKKKAIANLLAAFPFDGVEIAEPYFPEWDGIRRGVYGDVGPLARQAFLTQCGCVMPDFVNQRSPDYYKKNSSVYQKWIKFRVNAVNGFIDQMINGIGGAREVRPDIAVATWSLAVDDGLDSRDRLREWQGLDAVSMINKVKPDLHVLQTHWPDWTKSKLRADYIRNYEPFVKEIRTAHPNVPIAVQADIGSARNMIRGRSWLNAFVATVKEEGYDSWTAYEYHIGGYMYESRPFPIKAARISDTEVIVSFNKRIDPETCRLFKDHFGVYDEGGFRFARIESIQVDGNRLYMRSGRFPRSSFELTIPRIKDTPELWLFKDYQSNEVAAGTHIKIPASAS